jgi:hypothetical protein
MDKTKAEGDSAAPKRHFWWGMVIGLGALALWKSSPKAAVVYVIIVGAIWLSVPLFRKLNRKLDEVGGIPPATDEGPAETFSKIETSDRFEIRKPNQPG